MSSSGAPKGASATPLAMPNRTQRAGAGHRCCSTGGFWHNAEYKIDTPSTVPREEEQEFSKLGGANRFTLKAYYYKLKNKAKVGNLSISANEVKPGIGSQLLRRDELFELIITKQEEKDDSHISLRLYFAEPPQVDDLLLAIGFTRKPSKSDVDGTQNSHIREAYYRFDRGAKLANPWGLELESSTKGEQ
ncbi:hypothetical protein HBA56_04150 [Pseudoteredinibacter isoporae]|nr:hypothetical protein [Pseudoteredinibacter isoporae]